MNSALPCHARDQTAAGEAVFDHVTAARDRLLARIAETGAFSPKP